MNYYRSTVLCTYIATIVWQKFIGGNFVAYFVTKSCVNNLYKYIHTEYKHKLAPDCYLEVLASNGTQLKQVSIE